MAENYITRQEEKGTVNISEDVIALMVNAAVAEVEGVAGPGSASTPELADLFGRKSSAKSPKIRVEDGCIAIEVLIVVRAGGSITDVAVRVQDAVCREVESSTGMDCKVNVHVTGVTFEKDE